MSCCDRKPCLRERLAAGETVFGPFAKLASPQVVEIAGYAGFDFMIFDTEHGPLSFESIENLTRAAELVGVAPIVRTYENSAALISRALDVGAQGVVVPHITSRAEAEELARASRFFPQGDRGVCRFVRAAGFTSVDRFEYMRRASAQALVIGIIESKDGLANLDEILSVEGLDVVFIGPYDLSQSLGLPGQVRHERVLASMQAVVEQARRRGRSVGTFVDNVADAKYWADAGVQFISFSVDVGIVYEAMKASVDQLRAVCLPKR